MVEPKSSPLEYFKLLGVFALILGITLASGARISDAQNLMRIFMGVFFTIFAIFKLVDLKMFSYVFASYDLLAKRLRTYGLIYPFIELTLGVLYLMGLGGFWRDIFTAGILLFGSIGIALKLRTKEIVPCACLGKYIRLPLSTVSLFEDVGMGLMAIGMMLI